MRVPSAGRLSPHAVGLLLTSAGVVLLSPDSLILRLLTPDQWTVLLWRGLGMSAGLALVYWVIWARRRFVSEVRALGGAGLLGAALFASDNILFVTAISHTSVANALVILSTGPLFAAVLSRVFLAERVPLRTWVATLTVIGGVAVILSGGIGQGTLGGDLAALGAALSIAGTFVVIRRSRARNMIPAMALGSFIAALTVLPFARPASPTSADALLLALAGLVLLPGAFALITLGPRYLRAPEVNLLMLGETVLGPIWVWLILRETPAAATFVGGSVILAALTTHALAGRRPRGQLPAAPAT